MPRRTWYRLIATALLSLAALTGIGLCVLEKTTYALLVVAFYGMPALAVAILNALLLDGLDVFLKKASEKALGSSSLPAIFLLAFLTASDGWKLLSAAGFISTGLVNTAYSVRAIRRERP